MTDTRFATHAPAARPSRGNALAAMVSAIALALLAACGQGGDTKAPAAGGLGPLEHFVKDSVSDTWTTRMEGGTFHLLNTKDRNLVRRYFLDVDESVIGAREVSVDVSVANGTETSRGGLIFGVRPNAKDYYIFVTEANQMAAVYHRTENGQQELLKVKNESIGPGFTRLGIKEEGPRLFFLVNGQQVGAYDLEAQDRGAPGIIAWGIGDFSFTNFTHSPEIAAPPQG